MDEPELLTPEDAARELRAAMDIPEPAKAEDAAHELRTNCGENRGRPLYTGVAIAGINLGLLALAAIPIGMNYRLHEHGALPLVVLPFAASGALCGAVAHRRILGWAALSLNICAAIATFYAPELLKM